MLLIITFWISLIGYALGMVFYLFYVFFGKGRLSQLANVITILAFCSHTINLVARWIIAKHAPFVSSFETIYSAAWLAAFTFLIIQLFFKKIESIGSIVLPLIFLTVGLAYINSMEIEPAVPATRSPWLIIHALFAELAFGCVLVAVAASIIYLVKERRGEVTGSFVDRFPEISILDQANYKLMAIGFICLAIMIVSGAIWADLLWGSYWSWDPVETWSLITWLIFGLYLHLRTTYNWKGKKAAYFTIVSFVFVVIAIWGVPTFTSSIHSITSIQ